MVGLKIKTMNNLFKMGHCAPTVMHTVRQAMGEKDEYLVKLTSGLPGGIANCGAECGAITSPIMNIVLKLGYSLSNGGASKSISLGIIHLKRFKNIHGTLYCRDILKNKRNPLPCIKAVCSAPPILMEVLDEDGTNIAKPTSRVYNKLLKSFHHQRFHCSHSVLSELDNQIIADEKLLRASWGFIGGTLMQGMTCGALTAGVLVIGSIFGGIEDSYLRVLRMVGLMVAGRDAMKNDINKFNKAINIGNNLALKFIGEFGSSNCREITKTNFSSDEEIEIYFKENRMNRCKEISSWVANWVRNIADGNR
jgi:C_GCAxxG_C_C family probable redox protein